MIEYALVFGFFAVSVALLLNLYRLIVGPTVMDRVLAIDTMVINTIALIIFYGIEEASTVYFEVALVFAMFGFISTVSYCRFILRGNVID